MDRTPARPLLITAVVLAFIVPAVLIGGLLERAYVGRAFASAEQTRAARATALAALRYQLDEETGLRGYTSTHDRAFLDPFYVGSGKLALALTTLGQQTAALNDGSASLALDAAEINALWVRTVATPLRTGTAHDDYATQLRGKALVDRFRHDINAIADDLLARELAVDASARQAIDRIFLITLAAVVVIVLASGSFAIAQSRLAARLDAQRARADEAARRNAELRAAYAAEKRIADTLQDAFVQRPLPDHPLLSFSATYVPASDEAKVGGDWYDAIELSDQRVMFSLGDVEGHGIEAAVSMSRTRQALITSALVGTNPVEILDRVNRELVRTTARMVTAVIGFADAATYQFVYATAGHPPPVLLEPGRLPRMLACGGLPLGVLPDAKYSLVRVQSVPGAQLVLYTDGAVEHSRDVIEGEAMLLGAVASAAKSRDFASKIHDAIFADRAVGDDVAILTIGFGSSERTGLTVSGEYAQTAFAGVVGHGGNGGAAVGESPRHARERTARQVA
jgi:serine phosphatase RsbU (regulator of sigma subunit)